MEVVDQALAMVRASNSERDSLEHYGLLTAKQTLRIVAANAGLSEDPSIRKALNANPTRRWSMLTATNLAVDALQRKYRDTIDRRRPSLEIGAFLIILGFVLQAVAAMPENAWDDFSSFIYRMFSEPSPMLF